MKDLLDLQVGDVVTRYLGGILPMKLKVTELTNYRIICGEWKFDWFGNEVDEDLSISPSYIKWYETV